METGFGHDPITTTGLFLRQKTKPLLPAKTFPDIFSSIAAVWEELVIPLIGELSEGLGETSQQEMKGQHWRIDWQQNKFSSANCNVLWRCSTCSHQTRFRIS
jgi:hypothetical protein